jgi:hypothetical protein
MNKKLLSSAVALALTAGASYAGANTTSPLTLNNNLDRVINVDLSNVPTIDNFQQSNSTLQITSPSSTQLSAINQFKVNHQNAQIHLNQLTGTVDSMIGIAISVSGNSPEQMALNFINEHNSLFEGLNLQQLQVNQFRSKPALGGHIVRFDQHINGVKVQGNGLGLVIDSNNRVRSVMGPYQRDVNVDTAPSITAEQAVFTAQQNLSSFQKIIPNTALSVLNPAYAKIEATLGLFKTPIPELVLVQTANGQSLAWQFYYYSTNPFGVFKYQVDAHSNEILFREDQVKRFEQDAVTEQFADYFPTFPPITSALQNDCQILDEDGGETGRADGLLRIKLRKFDETNRVTGPAGMLTGKHAHIENALPTKLPFAQAALGTYYFDEDAVPLTARPNERDHLAEPAEHLDGISQFIYITNLMEYLDYLHKDGDLVHSRGFGTGNFPDQYPNESVPLVGIVHIPNVLDAPTDTSDPEFAQKLLGLDNAFAIPLSQEINGAEVVVNPTFYGHGYLFNNLAIDFSVPMHEGTHATITPIAGFEGSPEGGALNEGQADLWAYTIGETPDLGKYPVNSCDLRQYLADNHVDPDSFEYIRSGQSQIRYSQLGTRDNTFEVHRDGEIYAGAMWDLRELMVQMYPQSQFKRPDPVSGSATIATSLGKETWERIFLASMYVLGSSTTDTFVKARDAVLVADAILYPANVMDLNSLGQHHALIERVFAARELGANAEAPLGGVQMISTAVSDFTANQASAGAPQRVVADIIDQQSINISWQAVDGAVGYQLLKRQGGNPTRLFAGVPGREYVDGDLDFNGYTHVEFISGDNTNYIDKGQGLGRGAGQGLDALDYQYVVRSIALNESGQVGFSKLSGTAKTKLTTTNVTNKVSSRISNVSFSNGQFSFDNSLVNNTNSNLYGPVAFNIVSISSNHVTVANADNNGSGQAGNAALFRYDQALVPATESSARRLVFNNPMAELFTFKAKILAQVAGQSTPVNGSQTSTDNSAPAAREQVYHAISQESGMVLIGTAEQVILDGIDYVDVPLHPLPSATSVVATLTADTEVAGAYPDLDFMLLDSDGKVISSSGNLGASEQVSGTVDAGKTYTLRVKGYANGPTQFHIVIDQLVTDPADAGTTSTATTDLVDDEQLIEFIINPLSNVVLTRPL